MHEFIELKPFTISDQGDPSLDKKTTDADLKNTRAIKIPIPNPKLSFQSREKLLDRYMRKQLEASPRQNEYLRPIIPSHN
jgi:hypothetical protein